MDGFLLAWRWLANAALGGTIVLLLGSLAAQFFTQPAKRARIVLLTLLGGLAVPWLGYLPIAPKWFAGVFQTPATIPADGAAARVGQVATTLAAPARPTSTLTERPSRPAAIAVDSARIPKLAANREPSNQQAGAPLGAGVSPSHCASSVLVVRPGSYALHCCGGRTGCVVARRSVLALASAPLGADGSVVRSGRVLANRRPGWPGRHPA